MKISPPPLSPNPLAVISRERGEECEAGALTTGGKVARGALRGPHAQPRRADLQSDRGTREGSHLGRGQTGWYGAAPLSAGRLLNSEEHIQILVRRIFTFGVPGWRRERTPRVPMR